MIRHMAASQQKSSIYSKHRSFKYFEEVFLKSFVFWLLHEQRLYLILASVAEGEL